MQLPWPSFFCNAEKRPTCPHGYGDAALPRDGACDLGGAQWSRRASSGFRPASGSGFSVLDIDKGKGGGDWWAANKARLPATRMHRTRSGGIHCPFRHRAGLLNSVCKIAPGVDVRASGGYVIWWPSHGFPVVDHELAKWPEWLTPPEPPPPPRRDPPSPRQAVAAVEGIVRVVATAPKGQRNAVTYWGARRMRELRDEGRLTRELGARQEDARPRRCAMGFRRSRPPAP